MSSARRLLLVLSASAAVACANELVAEDRPPPADGPAPADSAGGGTADGRPDAATVSGADARVADASVRTDPFVLFELDEVLFDYSAVAEGRAILLGALATLSIEGRTEDDAGGDSISMLLFGSPAGTGSYACDGKTRLTLVLDGEAHVATSCAVDVTEVGEVGERIEGTFSASFGDDLRLERGHFSVPRVP